MPVDTTRCGRTLVIALNRPQAMNRLDTEMYAPLSSAWDQVESGGAFRSGSRR